MNESSGFAAAPPKPTTLRAHAASVVREMVIAGTLVPGQRINEVELANDLDLSRGILREALSALERDGLLTSQPRRGLFVRRLTPEEASDISEVRLALETAAALRIARGPVEPALEVLSEHYRELERVAEEPYATRTRADLAFHEAVCVCSGNAELLRSWRALMGSYLAMLLSVVPASESVLAPERHRPLLEAIEAGDQETIQAAWADHFSRGVADIVSLLEDPATDSPGAA